MTPFIQKQKRKKPQKDRGEVPMNGFPAKPDAMTLRTKLAENRIKLEEKNQSRIHTWNKRTAIDCPAKTKKLAQVVLVGNKKSKTSPKILRSGTSRSPRTMVRQARRPGGKASRSFSGLIPGGKIDCSNKNWDGRLDVFWKLVNRKKQFV